MNDRGTMDVYVVVNGLNNESIEEVSENILEIEKKTWDEKLGASLETIRHRLSIFPEGLWRLYHNKRLVSYMYFIRVDEKKKYYSWFDYCEGGTCNNYKQDGKLLFGVSIGSIEKHMGNYLFSVGMDQIIEGYYKGVENVCMCSRIPSLCKKYKNVNEVPELNLDSVILMDDHVVKMFIKKGCKPISFCKEGYSIDNESYGYSLTMGRKVNED